MFGRASPLASESINTKQYPTPKACSVDTQASELLWKKVDFSSRFLLVKVGSRVRVRRYSGEGDDNRRRYRKTFRGFVEFLLDQITAVLQVHGGPARCK